MSYVFRTVGSAIPMSTELMIDSGMIGPRHNYENADLWRRQWLDRKTPMYMPIFSSMAPPWEYWEKPIRFTFEPFPRTTRIANRITHRHKAIKWRIQETWQTARHGIPERDW